MNSFIRVWKKLKRIGIKKIAKDYSKNPSLAIYYYLDMNFRRLILLTFNKKIRNKYYAGKVKIDANKAQEILAKAIECDDIPYMAGRLGGIETEFMKRIELYNNGIINDINIEEVKALCINCGFFPPNIQALEQFYDIMCAAMKECDLLGVWYNDLENYFCRKYMTKTAQITDRYAFDIYKFQSPFTYALRGKKVLIVHPFSKSIENQYQRRALLFKNKNVLPEFELLTVKAVQTAGGNIDERFQTWFEALDYMADLCLKKEFDIAIIGCGAYGFPLAARLKKAGKVAIHMGGVSQILFGIKGGRWDNDKDIVTDFYNEYWVRPLFEETPEQAKKVENACYW